MSYGGIIGTKMKIFYVSKLKEKKFEKYISFLQNSIPPSSLEKRVTPQIFETEIPELVVVVVMHVDK